MEQAETHIERLPWTMGVAIVVLLAGALAIGLLPGAHSAANRAAAYFVDSRGYAAQALHAAHLVVVAPTAANWTGLGLGLGFLSVLLALGVAGLALYGQSLRRRHPLVQAVRGLERPLGLLHRVHSGHVGDYVAWLMMGTAVLAGFIALPLR